ncbi:MAG: efflux RND transporter periplasmic adaptor subunit [Phycisphaerales bacterium]
MTIARAMQALVLLMIASTPSLAQYPQSVVVDAARVEPLTAMRSVKGDIRTTRQSLVAAQVDGFVIELKLLEGDPVEEGQVIARLDPELAELDVARARAAVASNEGTVAEFEALLDQAKRDLERFRAADRGGSLSATELDSAETAVRTREAELARAQADLASARAQLTREERMLRDKTIRAPFAGVVIEKHTELGEWVTPGDAILDLVSVRELEAIIEVPEQFVGLLEIGSTPIRISVPALGDRGMVEATIDAIIPLADELSRLFPVRLGVPNDSGLLKPGMSLTAHVPTGRVEPTLTVSKDAILRDDAGEYVYTAVPHSVEGNPAVTAQAIPARITRLFAVGNRVAIRAGQVQDGSLLLVEGNERVYPTQPLIIQDPPPGSPFASGSGEGG